MTIKQTFNLELLIKQRFNIRLSTESRAANELEATQSAAPERAENVSSGCLNGEPTRIYITHTNIAKLRV